MLEVAVDIRFIKSCKNEKTIPIFAKVNLSYGNYKLQLRIARTVMKTERQNKHRENNKLKKEIKNIGVQFINALVLIYNTLMHHINKPIGSSSPQEDNILWKITLTKTRKWRKNSGTN